MNTAVLFLIFNRPNATKQVFDAIRLAKPSRLYLAADGPRRNRVEEAKHCTEVRRIATSVDWDCEVHTLFQDENLGCRLAISGALDWFFSAEECGIILEDDCLPSVSWFSFAHEMLERFKNEEQIMCIAANHFWGEAHRLEYSYFFSIYAHCWGWASWRRAWQLYDRNMQNWPIVRETDFLAKLGNDDPVFVRYWKQVFDMAYEGNKVDSWAYRWLYSCWVNSGLAVLPAKNLVNNLGIGNDATHTHSVDSVISSLRNEELDFPLIHPPEIIRDMESDAWESVNVYGVTITNLVKHYMRNLPVIGGYLALFYRTLVKFLYKLNRR